MTDPQASQGFSDKWRARWPEWRIAELFFPPSQRAIAATWFALLEEWVDAALGGQDPAPGLAKLAWWQEELIGWSKGARRHPLGTILQGQPADWKTVAQSLSALRHRDVLLAANDASVVALLPLADAICSTEIVLFGEAASASSVCAQCLASQPAVHPSKRPTLWNIASLQKRRAGAAPRRILTALTHARMLEEGKSGRWEPVSPWRALWLAWRAARQTY